MTDQPCTRDASAWAVSGPPCPECRHGGAFHKGGNAGQFRQCLICNLCLLESALCVRENNLRKREAELDALKSELEYALMEAKAIIHGGPYTMRTHMENTMAYGDVIIP